MEVYVGYGFDVNDLDNEDLFSFVKNFEDKDKFDEMVCEALELKEAVPLESLSKEDVEKAVDYTREWIEEMSFLSDYLAEVINEKAGEEILGTCDNFLMFYSIRFVGDCENRSRIIQNEGDFVHFVRKYFPKARITCGNIYEGSSRDCYPFMDC